MDELFEALLELLFDLMLEISSNSKISKWIRYPLILIITLIFIIVIFGLMIIGLDLLKENIYIGSFLVLISIVLLISAILNYKKIYLENRKEKK